MNEPNEKPKEFIHQDSRSIFSFMLKNAGLLFISTGLVALFLVMVMKEQMYAFVLIGVGVFVYLVSRAIHIFDPPKPKSNPVIPHATM